MFVSVYWVPYDAKRLNYPNNKDENAYRFTLSGELLERDRKRVREKGEREKEIERETREREVGHFRRNQQEKSVYFCSYI